MGTIKNEKLVESPTFEVKDNVLWFDDYFLQLSNISQVQALEVEALPYKYPLFLPVRASLFSSCSKCFWE